jgi:hypothetical protein
MTFLNARLLPEDVAEIRDNYFKLRRPRVYAKKENSTRFINGIPRERTPVKDGKLSWFPTTMFPLPLNHLTGFLELSRWRHDFPPPQNIVAEQLAAASSHQANSGNKESLGWSPDTKKWDFLEPHDTDWLLVEFLSKHDDRRAGPWQHAKAQLTLYDLFHVPFPHAAPKPITPTRRVSVSTRNLSKFAKERGRREGFQYVRENSVIELVSDALGGARFKAIEDPLEYLQSFVPEEVPLHTTAPDPLGRHQADMDEFARLAAKKCPHGVYDPHGDASYCSVCNPQIVNDGVIEKIVGGIAIGTAPNLKPTREQVKEFNKILAKKGFKGELSGLKWRTKSGKEVDRTPFEDALHDAVGADLTIINADGEYLRRLGEYGEVFRRYYGKNPNQQFPEFKRDLYLLETALSKDWKSDAERKEWQRRLDRMYFFIHGVCPAGTCLNNRCANPKLSPNERLWTHAVNLLQRVAPHKVAQLKVGAFYVVVVLQGQPRLNLLKAKTAEQASAEFERLVESKVTKARVEARRQNKSEKEAERSIRAAYQVADLLLVASEAYPQSHQQDVAAD